MAATTIEATAETELKCDLLDRCKLDTGAGECRVDEFVTDRNEYQQGNGVEVLDKVVWQTIQFHGTRLSDEVVGPANVG